MKFDSLFVASLAGDRRDLIKKPVASDVEELRVVDEDDIEDVTDLLVKKKVRRSQMC